MINRSVAITIGFVLVGGVGVSSALGSLAGDPTDPTISIPTTTIGAVEDAPQGSNAPESGSIILDPTATVPSMPGLVVAGMPSAPPPVSIARGGDDDDDDHDDDDDDDHDDDDDDDHDDDDHDDDDHDDDEDDD